jgi:hypothetical protein
MSGDVVTMEDLSDCMNDGPCYGEAGYVGDIEELREYPCNCAYCRGVGEPCET